MYIYDILTFHVSSDMLEFINSNQLEVVSFTHSIKYSYNKYTGEESSYTQEYKVLIRKKNNEQEN